MIEIPTLVDQETFMEIFDKAVDMAEDGMVFVEIGVYVGGSTCYLGQRLKEKGVSLHLFSIDNFKFDTISEEHKSSLNYKGSPYVIFANNLRRCGINSNVMIGDSIDISAVFKDNSIDFLFIDGCHSNPYVEKELVAWLPKMKPNSLIGGHDYASSKDVQSTVKKILVDFNTTSTELSYYKILESEPTEMSKDKINKKQINGIWRMIQWIISWFGGK